MAVAADLVEPGEQLVLVVDQFEELWTLVDTDQTRDRFAELLTHAARQRVALRVVVTLRADLYDRPLQHPGLGPVVSHSTFRGHPDDRRRTANRDRRARRTRRSAIRARTRRHDGR